MISAVRATCVAVLAAGVVACGSSAFSIGSPSVDASHTCPTGASNAPYELHANASADNPTSQTVDVRSVSAVMVLAAVHGAWQQKVGSEYDAGPVQFSPKTFSAGSKAELKVTIPSACTNGPHPAEDGEAECILPTAPDLGGHVQAHEHEQAPNPGRLGLCLRGGDAGVSGCACGPAQDPTRRRGQAAAWLPRPCLRARPARDALAASGPGRRASA